MGNLDLKKIKYEDLSLDNELIITVFYIDTYQTDSFVIEKEEFDFEWLSNHNSLKDFTKWLVRTSRRSMTVHFNNGDEILLVE